MGMGRVRPRIGSILCLQAFRREGYEGPLEFAVLQSGDYTGEPLVTDYSTVCQNHESYAEMCGKLSLPGEPERLDFNAYSVLCIVDTLRPFPTYQIGVSGVNETADYVECGK